MASLKNTEFIWKIDSLDKRTPVNAIYLDFSKAFDYVPHQRLLKKVKSYTICGNVLTWIESFLLDKKQRVKVKQMVLYHYQNGETSPVEYLKAVYEDLCSLPYIKGLPKAANNTCSICEDDTKLYGPAHESWSASNDINMWVFWCVFLWLFCEFFLSMIHRLRKELNDHADALNQMCMTTIN